jgi:hypothetical protein
MMLAGFSNALKGIGGQYEITRLIGGFGALAYVVGAHVFLAWNEYQGLHFDLATYCLAFPTGLGVAVGATAGASALKDRGVATSKIISETGAIPAKPPAGPQVPDQSEGNP